MRTRPYPNEKIDRNKEIVNDYAQGMEEVDMVVKYRITATRIKQILKRSREKLG